MKKQWEKSKSPAAAGLSAEGNVAEFGLADFVPDSTREQALKNLRLAELEYERATLRRKLNQPTEKAKSVPQN